MRLVLPLLLLSCASKPEPKVASDATADSPVVEDTGEVLESSLQFRFEQRELVTEVLDACDDATVIEDYLRLCATADGMLLKDERDGTAILLGQYESVAAAHFPGGQAILALDGLLYTLEEAALNPVVSDIDTPIERLVEGSDSLWLWGLGHLYRWRGESITEITLPEYPTIYDFEVSENRLYASVPWLAEVDVSGDSPSMIAFEETIPQSMAVDMDGGLWYVVSDQLFLKRAGELTRRMDMPEAVHSVVGPQIWVRGVESIYRYHAASFSRHSVGAASMLAVDGYGRLLEMQEGQLMRHSIDRPVVVVGLSESVLVREMAQLLPSDPASISALHVWMNDQPLDVTVSPWTVVVEPEGLTDGVHQLQIYSESDLGDHLSAHSFWVGELPEVEWSEIEDLSNEHCIACHGGATLTDLSTKEGWEQRINSIIDQVSGNLMPLGGPFLSDYEITMIRGWKYGGFQ